MSSTDTGSSAIIALNVLNVIAYMANAGLVNGVPFLFNLPDNGQISEKYQTIVTPAGYAFAIWGLIFLMQAIWCVVQLALPAVRGNPLVVHGVGYNYIGVCAFQVAWTFAFGLEQIVLSMLWMLGILYYLIRIYRSLHKVLKESHDESFRNSHNYWLLRFPFDLHLGWIVAATLVNFNVVLQAHDVSTPLKFTTGILTVAIAFTVGGLVLYTEIDSKTPNVVVPVVLVWALHAISSELKNPKSLILSTYSTEEIDVIKQGSMAAALLILLAVIAIVGRAMWKSRTEGRAEEARLLNEE